MSIETSPFKMCHECLHIRNQLWKQFNKLLFKKEVQFIEYEGFKYEVRFIDESDNFRGTWIISDEIHKLMTEDGLFDYDT